ncbi:MAG: hypothetical protein LBK63_01805 [Treponema sp.]|jgi:uncharacterized protein YlzI (FlbEa/FlbD family)|nr:hypothetical protein [Treponema sp.]
MRKQLWAISCLALLLGGCNRAITGDAESDRALAAFNAMVKTNLDRKGYHDAMKHWGLSLPGGGKFEWTKDTSANEADFAMVIPAEPFIRAGLDVGRLEGTGYVFQAAKIEAGESLPDLLLRLYNVSDKKENAQGSEDALRRILKQRNTIVQYDEDRRQYRLFLYDGGDDPFEVWWTETLGQGEADMVFVIAADPLMRAGLDPGRLDGGWVFQEAEAGGVPNRLVERYAWSPRNAGE